MKTLFISLIVLFPVAALAGPETRINSHVSAGPFAYLPIYFESPRLSGQAAATLRPREADYFYPGFAKKRIGMSFRYSQVEITSLRRFVLADVSFRRYLLNPEGRPGRDSWFVGAGFGVLGVAWDEEQIMHRSVSVSAEIGYEYSPIADMVVNLSLQGHRLKVAPANLNGIGVVLGVGWRLQ